MPGDIDGSDADMVAPKEDVKNGTSPRGELPLEVHM